MFHLRGPMVCYLRRSACLRRRRRVRQQSRRRRRRRRRRRLKPLQLRPQTSTWIEMQNNFALAPVLVFSRLHIWELVEGAPKRRRLCHEYPTCVQNSHLTFWKQPREFLKKPFMAQFLVQGGEYLNVPLSILFPFLLTLDAGWKS